MQCSANKALHSSVASAQMIRNLFEGPMRSSPGRRTTLRSRIWNRVWAGKNGQVTHLIVAVVNSSWLVLFVVVRLTVFVALGGVRIQKGWLFADLPGVGAG